MTLAFLRRQLARRGKSVTLENRTITPPDFGSPDFDEAFSTAATVDALIDTQRGSTLFDGVATDRPVTHKFCIEYIAGVTAETWVLFGGRRFDVVDVENYEERDFCLILRCAERGIGEAAKV